MKLFKKALAILLTALLAAMLMLVDIAVRRLTLADIRRMFSRQPSEK